MTDLQLELKMIKSIISDGIIGCESYKGAHLSILEIQSFASHIDELCRFKKITKIELTLEEVDQIINKIQEWNESGYGKADGTSLCGIKISDKCKESVLSLRKYCN